MCTAYFQKSLNAAQTGKMLQNERRKHNCKLGNGMHSLLTSTPDERGMTNTYLSLKPIIVINSLALTKE